MGKRFVVSGMKEDPLKTFSTRRELSPTVGLMPGQCRRHESNNLVLLDMDFIPLDNRDKDVARGTLDVRRQQWN